MTLERLTPTCITKLNPDPDLTPCTHITSQRITELTVKYKTIKFLEDDIGVNLDDLGFSDDFLDSTPKP